MQHLRGSCSTDAAVAVAMSWAATVQWLMDISSAEDALGIEQYAEGILLEHLPR